MVMLAKIRVENVLGCQYGEMDISQRAVSIVGGNNHMGKSSWLKGLEIAFLGKRYWPPEPIKDGEETAEVSVHVTPEEGDTILPWPCTITRHFTRSEDGGSYTHKLEIIADDGYKAGSPQELLDQLLNGGFSFDPLKFVRAKAREQVNMLRDLVGLDFDKLDHKREVAYNKRADINRKVRDITGEINQLPNFDNLPQERVDVTALMERLEAINSYNNDMRRKMQLAESYETDIKNTDYQIASLEKQLQEAQQRRAYFVDQMTAATTELETMEVQDPEPIRNEIRDAGDINRQIDQRDQVLSLMEKRNALQKESKAYSGEIKKIDRDKAAQTAAADWPIEGLGFGKDGVELNGIPFQQLSSSEQLNCSVAIALHKNPKFKLAIVQDGSLLDDNSLMELTEIVARHGGKCLVEKVGREHCHIVFDEGVGTLCND